MRDDDDDMYTLKRNKTKRAGKKKRKEKKGEGGAVNYRNKTKKNNRGCLHVKKIMCCGLEKDEMNESVLGLRY